MAAAAINPLLERASTECEGLAKARHAVDALRDALVAAAGAQAATAELLDPLFHGLGGFHEPVDHALDAVRTAARLVGLVF